MGDVALLPGKGLNRREIIRTKRSDDYSCFEADVGGPAPPGDIEAWRARVAELDAELQGHAETCYDCGRLALRADMRCDIDSETTCCGTHIAVCQPCWRRRNAKDWGYQCHFCGEYWKPGYAAVVDGEQRPVCERCVAGGNVK